MYQFLTQTTRFVTEVTLTQSRHESKHLDANLTCLLLRFRYKQNALAVARTFHDRPMSPMDTAIFWTEYVVRHGGAPHMRSAALDLAWYQYLLLDVITFVVVIGAGILITLYIIVRKVLRSLKSKLRDSKAKNKKMN